MTNSQHLEVRASEIRAKLNTLSALDALTDEQTAEVAKLTKEYGDVETRKRAAIIAEGGDDKVTPTVDAETRERNEIRGRSRVGAYLMAALEGRLPAGAEGEYSAALGTPAGHIPIDMWEADRPTPSAEVRAATPAPTTGTGVNLAPVQPFLFAPSIASRIGIDMPSVASGAYSEMTITTALPAGARTKGADAAATAAALTAVTAKPRSISASLTVTLEDVASIGQSNFESALRQNASMALSDAYDAQCIAGSGTAPHVNGLINQLTNPTNPTDAPGFDDFVAAFVDAIDGLWASKPGEVAIVANVDAYKLSAKTFRDGSGGQSRAGDVAFSDYAKAHFGGWWTNKRMPATAATIARGIVYRMGQRGIRTASHPTWGTIAIDDIYTDSRSGQRHFTLHVMVGDKVLIVQPDAYDLVEFKVS